MRIVHHNKNAKTSKKKPALRVVRERGKSAPENPDQEEWNQVARRYEASGDLDEAIEAYLLYLKEHSRHEHSYQRVMILLRKQGDLQREFKILEKAIAEFEQLYQPSAKRIHGTRIQTISKALMKSTGLADKKGKSLYLPEPLGKWYRRKEQLEKKLAAGKT